MKLDLMAIKPYRSLLRVRFLNGLQYRAAALSGLITHFFWGILGILIFEAFYRSGGTQTFSFPELVAYKWLQQAFIGLLMLYDWDFELFGMITSGGISYELCRPSSLYGLWYVKLLSKRLSGTLLRFCPILLVAFMLPAPYTLTLPASPLAFLLFIVTLFLGLLLLVSISMLIYISVFKTLSPVGSMAFIGLIGEFFSGMTIPIPLMPNWLQTVCYVLPFRYTSDLSLRSYTGSIPPDEALLGMGIQCLFIACFISMGLWFMRRITRKIIIQGG